MKDFKCDNCGHIICQRQGNTILVGRFELELKKPRNIKCSECGVHTRFRIWGQEKNVDTAKEIAVKLA